MEFKPFFFPQGPCVKLLPSPLLFFVLPPNPSPEINLLVSFSWKTETGLSLFRKPFQLPTENRELFFLTFPAPGVPAGTVESGCLTRMPPRVLKSFSGFCWLRQTPEKTLWLRFPVNGAAKLPLPISLLISQPPPFFLSPPPSSSPRFFCSSAHWFPHLFPIFPFLFPPSPKCPFHPPPDGLRMALCSHPDFFTPDTTIPPTCSAPLLPRWPTLIFFVHPRSGVVLFC